MSDTPLGPGWWLASDGKYYPPRSQPPGSPLPPPGSASIAPTSTHAYVLPGATASPTRSVSVGLSGTLQGFFWAMLGLGLVAALLAIVNLVAFNAWWDSPIGSSEERDALDDWSALEDALQGVGGLMALAGVTLFVLLVIWANKAHKTTQQLWSGTRQWTSGWTVGAWFIPLANLVIPKLVLNEIERIAAAPRTGGRVGEDWPRHPTSMVGWLWWLGLIIGGVLNAIGSSLGSESDSSAGEVRLGYVVNSVGLTIAALAAACGALYVRRLSARLTAAGLREEP